MNCLSLLILLLYLLYQTGPRTPPPSPGQLQREREARELKDQQKLKEMQQSSSFNCCSPHLGIPVASTVFLDTLMGALSVKNDDSRCLFALCLIYAMLQNKGKEVSLRLLNCCIAYMCVHFPIIMYANVLVHL